MSEDWKASFRRSKAMGHRRNVTRDPEYVPSVPPSLLAKINEVAQAACASIDVRTYTEALLTVLQNLSFAPGQRPPGTLPYDFLEMCGVVDLSHADLDESTIYTALALWNAGGVYRNSSGPLPQTASLVRINQFDLEAMIETGELRHPVFEDFPIGRVQPGTTNIDLQLAAPIPPKRALRIDDPVLILC